MMRTRILVLFGFLCWAVSARAQQPGDARQSYTNRGQLEALLLQLDSASRGSTGHGRGGDRAAALRSAAALRVRLTEGDFQPGDRVLLSVEREQQLSDTFTVNESRAIVLPVIGTVPLAGVLRAETEEYLRGRLAVYIQNPIVHARPLVRVGVIGEVTRPGFYLVPPGAQVEDVLMAAGGPTREAKLGGLTLQSVSGHTVHKDVLQQAVREGRSLDQLGVRSGDRLVVPRHGDWTRIATVVGALAAVPATIFALTRAF